MIAEERLHLDVYINSPAVLRQPGRLHILNSYSCWKHLNIRIVSDESSNENDCYIYLIPLAKAMSKFSTRQYTRQAAIISTIAKYYFIHVASLSHTLALLSTAYMRTDDKGGSEWWRQGWGRGTGTSHVTHHTTSLLHPTAIATQSIARYLAPATCEVTTYRSGMNHHRYSCTRRLCDFTWRPGNRTSCSRSSM